MSIVYPQYFQKSKVFLYPLLQLRKGIAYVPIETFIGWGNEYTPSDSKFLCLYVIRKDDKFNLFEKETLKSHPLFHTYHNLGNDFHLYVFDYSKYKYELHCFLEGSYSKFGIDAKNIILNFFSKNTPNAKYVNAYLYPNNHHHEYALDLDVPIAVIQSLYELCDKPDLTKEILSEEFHKIDDLLKTNSIPLTLQKRI